MSWFPNSKLWQDNKGLVWLCNSQKEWFWLSYSSTDAKRFFFSVRNSIINRWNSLSQEAVDASYVNEFKNQLDRIRTAGWVSLWTHMVRVTPWLYNARTVMSHSTRQRQQQQMMISFQLLQPYQVSYQVSIKSNINHKLGIMLGLIRKIPIGHNTHYISFDLSL